MWINTLTSDKISKFKYIKGIKNKKTTIIISKRNT